MTRWMAGDRRSLGAGEFVAEALKAKHPYAAEAALSGHLREAIFNCLSNDVNAVEAVRERSWRR